MWDIYFIAMFAFLACLEVMLFTARYLKQGYTAYETWSPLFFGALYYIFTVLIAAGVV